MRRAKADVKPSNAASATTTSEPEQTFLQRQLESLQKDPNRDPRASFRQAAAAVSASSAVDGGANAAGVVGPMGAGGLSLPGVERAMAEMEGGSAEEMKEKFARLGRRVSRCCCCCCYSSLLVSTASNNPPERSGVLRDIEWISMDRRVEMRQRADEQETKAGPLSPGEAPGRSGAAVPNEALHNFVGLAVIARLDTLIPVPRAVSYKGEDGYPGQIAVGDTGATTGERMIVGR